MKVKEILDEAFGPGFTNSEYNDTYAADVERGRMRDEMMTDFQNDRTPVSEFDLDEIRRMVMPAGRNKPDVKRQVEDVLKTWEELIDGDAYVDDDVFNKVFKQYEQLKDTDETPLIKFNKMHALTKEIKDAADAFDDWESGEGGDRWKDDNGHF